MTEKLYYLDSHIKEFDSAVLTCERAGDLFEVELQRTAFFPEGGGQSADTGCLGAARVLDVQERNGRLLHLCSAPLPAGGIVRGVIDWDRRFQNMQSHSAEHIVSGLIHRRFGYDNVGFHLGAEGIIVDFSGFLSPEELREIELSANCIVWENREINAFFPFPQELYRYDYRSKLELTENVRLVSIDGVDLCACCAPHVSRTGEIGLIRIYESQRRKNGVRIRMLAGRNALSDYLIKEAQVLRISELLSAKADSVADAAERLLGERDSLAYRLRGYRLEEIKSMIEGASAPDGDFIRFFTDFSQDDLLLTVKGVLPRCSGVCACLNGSDEEGYKFVIASNSVPLRDKLNAIRGEFKIKGGGSDAMVQGSIFGEKSKIMQAIGGFSK